MNSKNLESVIKLRHELHQHAELSNQEVWTKKRLISFLKENTKLEIIDRGKWFYAVYRSKKGLKNIAFRADFDAISMNETNDISYKSVNEGVSHKCGHDGHAATLAGFALEIDQKGSDNNIFFLFQHAEETGDGAIEAKVFIKENSIDEIFAYHNMSNLPFKSVSLKDDTIQCASKGMTISMVGLPAHASEPEKGRNPAFAIAKIIDSIPTLIQGKYKGMVLCTVIQVNIGERAFGVSAHKGEILLTIRALYESEMLELQTKLEKIAKEQAEIYGLKVQFTYNDAFPDTTNHKESADKVRKVSKILGLELIEMEEAFRGSEDFGHYLKETKGAIFYIGNGEDYCHLHSTEYDFRDDMIETAVEIFEEISKM